MAIILSASSEILRAARCSWICRKKALNRIGFPSKGVGSETLIFVVDSDGFTMTLPSSSFVFLNHDVEAGISSFSFLCSLILDGDVVIDDSGDECVS